MLAGARAEERWDGYAWRALRGYRGAMPYRDLNVLDAADQAVDRVNELIDRLPRGQLLHVRQLRDAVQSVAANISEGFGRGTGRDRGRPLEIARGEAEEAIRHLRANFRARRIEPKDYWPLRNLLVVISKMLTSILDG
jgi:four helix bundle protein